MSRPGASPGRMAQLPKRFYERVEVCEAGEGWGIRLDEREVRTPGKALLEVPTEGLARQIAGEWEAQGERVDPETMIATRIVNTAIDRVRGREGAVASDIAAYAGSDLVCYRADTPEGLVVKQGEHWDPVLTWAEGVLKARFVLASGIVHRAQSEETLAAVRGAFEGCDAFALSALHTVTTLTGSALLALALARGRLTADQVWAAAHVDEDWQISQWGEDAEAQARRAARGLEMAAAAGVLEC